LNIQPFHCGLRNRGERCAITRQNCGQHPGIPEVAKVLRGCGAGGFITLDREVASDLVGHVMQMGEIHCASTAQDEDRAKDNINLRPSRQDLVRQAPLDWSCNTRVEAS
jgi:hypothetical protein